VDPPNVDVDVQVLVLFLGVEHTVVSYYVTESETWTELEDGCYAFRDRLERLRNLSQYQSDEYKLEFWVDDKCCEGRDVLDHPVVRIFGLPRAPYKDLWHAINNVTKTCHVGFILDQQRLAVGLSKSLRELLGPDVEKVVQYLMAQRGLSKQAAEEQRGKPSARTAQFEAAHNMYKRSSSTSILLTHVGSSRGTKLRTTTNLAVFGSLRSLPSARSRPCGIFERTSRRVASTSLCRARTCMSAARDGG